MSSPAPTPKIDPARAAESYSVQIISVVTVFHALALIFVALRVYARAFVIKTFGRDDICMVLSAVRTLLSRKAGRILTTRDNRYVH
jgi:hypothetical protein